MLLDCNFLIYLVTLIHYIRYGIVNPSDGPMQVGSSLKAVNAKTKFVETGDRKIAYRYCYGGTDGLVALMIECLFERKGY
jgi:hypothetical protein